jgi:hypothetical protein
VLEVHFLGTEHHPQQNTEFDVGFDQAEILAGITYTKYLDVAWELLSGR